MPQEDKDKLKRYVTSALNSMFDAMLYNVEIGTRSEYQYSVLRKRILRAGNNTLREITSEIDHDTLEEYAHRPSITDTMDLG